LGMSGDVGDHALAEAGAWQAVGAALQHWCSHLHGDGGGAAPQPTSRAVEAAICAVSAIAMTPAIREAAEAASTVTAVVRALASFAANARAGDTQWAALGVLAQALPTPSLRVAFRAAGGWDAVRTLATHKTDDADFAARIGMVLRIAMVGDDGVAARAEFEGVGGAATLLALAERWCGDRAAAGAATEVLAALRAYSAGSESRQMSLAAAGGVALALRAVSVHGRVERLAEAAGGLLRNLAIPAANEARYRDAFPGMAEVLMAWMRNVDVAEEYVAAMSYAASAGNKDAFCAAAPGLFVIALRTHATSLTAGTLVKAVAEGVARHGMDPAVKRVFADAGGEGVRLLAAGVARHGRDSAAVAEVGFRALARLTIGQPDNAGAAGEVALTAAVSALTTHIDHVATVKEAAGVVWALVRGSPPLHSVAVAAGAEAALRGARDRWARASGGDVEAAEDCVRRCDNALSVVSGGGGGGGSGSGV